MDQTAAAAPATCVDCHAKPGGTGPTVSHHTTTACSTCHVIVDPAWFAGLEDPTEDEEDMLDLAFGLEKTSRLGCQIVMSDALDGLVVRLPAATRNVQAG